jgi:hypothetical protein
MRARTIYLHRLAACAPSAAIETIASFLEQNRNFTVKTTAGLSMPVQLSSRTVEDYTDPVRRHDALEFSWRAPQAWLPPLHATLTVRPHAPPGCELQLSISYVPPFGALGRIFDAAIGRRLAYVTATSLIRDAAAAIELHWAAQRGTSQTASVRESAVSQ